MLRWYFYVYQRDLLLCVTVVTLCAAVRFVVVGYGAVVFSSEILFLCVTMGTVVGSGENIFCVLRGSMLCVAVRFVMCYGGNCWVQW